MAYDVIAGKIIELAADGTKFKKSIREIDSETKLAQKTVNELKTSLENGWDNTKFKQAQELSQKAIDATSTKLELLKKRLEEINKGEKTEDTTKEFNKLTKEIAYTENQLSKAKSRLEELNSMKLDQIAKKIDEVGSKIENVGKKLSVASATVATAMTFAAKSAIDYEDAFAGVVKTVDASDEELSKMKDELLEMSNQIPTTATELAQIAESAGQLGIKKDNIISFTKTIADLGVATNLTGDEAASTLAKYANITQMDQKDFDKLGSTIVSLGNNSATTEKDIANMALRLAAAGKQAGMTDAQILSFSAALSSVGIEAEAGGSSFSKLFTNIQLAVETGSEDLKNFAAVSNMTVEEFKNAFENDAANAIISFINGLGNAEERGMSAIEVLDNMGISEVRMRDSLLRAAGAGDLFNTTIQIGTNAWNENIALTEEANKKYGTTASQIAIAQNNIKSIGIELGEVLLPIVINITNGIKDVTKWFNSLNDATKNNIVKIASFVVALGPMLTITGKISTGIVSLVKNVGGAITAIKAYKTASEGATLSQTALNTVMSANTFGIIAGVIATATAVLLSWNIASSVAGDNTDDLSKKVEELSNKVKDLKENYDKSKESIEDSKTAKLAELEVVKDLIPELDELSKKTNKTKDEKDRLNYIVEQLNEKLPNLKLAIDNETGALNTQISTIYNAVEAYQALARAKAAEDMLVESSKQKLSIEKEREDINKELDDMRNKISHYSEDYDKGLYEGNKQTRFNLILLEYEKLEEHLEELNNLKDEADKDIDFYTNYIKTETAEYNRLLDNSNNDNNDNNNNNNNIKDNSANNSSLNIVKKAGTSANKDTTKSTVEKLEDEYKEKLKLLKYEKELEIKSEAEYYEELENLCEEYLEEYSDEWISAQEEIYKYNKKQKENELKLEEEHQSELLKQFEEQKKAEISILEETEEAKINLIEKKYNKKIDIVNKEIEAEEKRINALIAGLEKEEEIENRRNSLYDADKRIEYIETQIKYSRDPNTTAELEKELIRLKNERDDLTNQYAIEDKKEALQKELEDKKEKANSDIAELTEKMETSIQRVKNQTSNAIEEVSNRTFDNQKMQLNQTFDLVKERAEELGGSLAQNTSNAIISSIENAAEKAKEIISQMELSIQNAKENLNKAEATITRQSKSGEHGTWGDWLPSNNSNDSSKSSINVATNIYTNTVTSGTVVSAAKKVVNALLGKY